MQVGSLTVVLHLIGVVPPLIRAIADMQRLQQIPAQVEQYQDIELHLLRF